MKVSGNGTVEQLEKDKPRGRCRKWRLWVTTECGRKSRRFEGTWTEAQDALKRFVAELSAQVPNESEFGAYAQSWRLWRATMGTVSANMSVKDERNLRALERTDLWGERMDAITPDMCREALRWMQENPAKGRPLSPATMASLHSCMTSIFGQAVADGALASSPMAGVAMPKIPKSDRRALSRDEMDALLDALDARQADGHVMALYLMVCLGLRRGEALGLYASDIDGSVVHVRRSVSDATGKVGEPKSDAGNRTLPMPPRLRDKVDEWTAMRSALGLADAPTLCCNVYGGVMRPQNMYKWWHAHRAELGCDGLTMHELRHSYLTLMARHVSPFDLQRLAGWSSLSPARIYVHDDLDALEKGVLDAFSAHERTKNAPVGK